MQREFSRSGSDRTRGARRDFGGLERLEGRALFDASLGGFTSNDQQTTTSAGPDVPVLAPVVLDAQFDDERAPHELRVRFSQDVFASLDGTDLVLINEQGRFIFPSEQITVHWDFDTNTASFVFVHADGGILPEGTWHATLLADGITNDAGIALDGDGDELPGGDHAFDFRFLQGDANRDGIVDLADFNIVAANFGQTGRTFGQGDFNYDGVVNLADFQLLASRIGSDQQQHPPIIGAGAESAQSTDGFGSKLIADSEDSSTSQMRPKMTQRNPKREFHLRKSA